MIVPVKCDSCACMMKGLAVVRRRASGCRREHLELICHTLGISTAKWPAISMTWGLSYGKLRIANERLRYVLKQGFGYLVDAVAVVQR
jgi:hypothetical protein